MRAAFALTCIAALTACAETITLSATETVDVGALSYTIVDVRPPAWLGKPSSISRASWGGGELIVPYTLEFAPHGLTSGRRGQQHFGVPVLPVSGMRYWFPGRGSSNPYG
jgi:hypothetical protein